MTDINYPPLRNQITFLPSYMIYSWHVMFVTSRTIFHMESATDNDILFLSNFLNGDTGKNTGMFFLWKNSSYRILFLTSTVFHERGFCVIPLRAECAQHRVIPDTWHPFCVSNVSIAIWVRLHVPSASSGDVLPWTRIHLCGTNATHRSHHSEFIPRQNVGKYNWHQLQRWVSHGVLSFYQVLSLLSYNVSFLLQVGKLQPVRSANGLRNWWKGPLLNMCGTLLNRFWLKLCTNEWISTAITIYFTTSNCAHMIDVQYVWCGSFISSTVICWTMSSWLYIPSPENVFWLIISPIFWQADVQITFEEVCSQNRILP